MRRLLVFAALVALAAGCATAPRRGAAPVVIRAFEVGFGDAFLVSHGRTHVLIDTGPVEAAPRLVEKLRATGVDALDVLILTHPHIDHAGGLAALLDSGIALRKVLHNGDEFSQVAGFDRLGTRAEQVVRASNRTAPFEVGALKLTVLHPDGRPQADPNNLSLVVLVEAGEAKALFLGDLVDPELQAGLCPKVPAELDVLKLGHHGDHIVPCLGDRGAVHLISIATNEWGMPRAEVLERYGTRIRRTDVEGDVTITLRSVR